MANMCSNTVTFYGDACNVADVMREFKKLEIEEIESGEAQQLDPEESAMFDLCTYEDTVGYETRWVPNKLSIRKIAQENGVDFIHHYEELGCQEYGTAILENNQYYDYYLDQKDLVKIEYDEEIDRYIFESKSYRQESQIYDQLLQRKIKSKKNRPQLISKI